jgi:phosphopentomutase
MASAFRRVILLVLDSVGVGALPDAADYGDEGSNTLVNIARAVPLRIPELQELGLTSIVTLPGIAPASQPAASFGKMAEASPGKDSTTGHWELMGLVLPRAFPVFAHGFPPALIQEFERRIGRATLGNVPASGTAIIDQLGAEHMRTGAPIVYTSADSVFQIAAHEEVVPLEELYRYCRVAYDLAVVELGVGRVIARPFIGGPGQFTRTPRRRDFSLPPTGETVLDRLHAAGHQVIGIGKIEDLFAGRGITRAVHGETDDENMDVVEESLSTVAQGLIVANLVDFDMKYGHRNDVEGYARNLERFDVRLAALRPQLAPEDLLIITADHGNDPTTPSTDHSREYVPLLVVGPRVLAGRNLGVRGTYADVGQTLAEIFDVGPMPHGSSFLSEIAVA